MTHTYFIVPTGSGTGLTSICLGIVRALEKVGLQVGFYKPIEQRKENDTGPERSSYFIEQVSAIQTQKPLPLHHCQQRVANQQVDRLMEDIVAGCQKSQQNKDVLIIEGLVPLRDQAYTVRLNTEIVKALDSDIILISSDLDDDKEFKEQIEFNAKLYGGLDNSKIVAHIINKSLTAKPKDENTHESHEIFRSKLPSLPLVGNIPLLPELLQPRISDVVNYLGAESIGKALGIYKNRRVTDTIICARTVPNICNSLLPGSLIVTPGDREDILVAAALAAVNGVPLSGILLTTGAHVSPLGNHTHQLTSHPTLLPDERVLKLCDRAINEFLPVLTVEKDTYTTSKLLSEMNNEVPFDDIERAELVMENIASFINTQWFLEHCKIPRHSTRVSPPAFRYQLVELATKAQKTIVLPEGEEPRTIQAAIICSKRNIARCVLLGDKQKIIATVESLGLSLPDNLQIVAPVSVRTDYIDPMVELRKHKQLTPIMAESQLEDNVVLGTMMLAQSHVDGLVSGAIHTTANTIRPALQLIKTHSSARLVSSIFFMCLPEQVLIYGDCAVNPDPSAEELADIAIQSAASAEAFGLPVRVAMISYSTGSSGHGSDVEKVRAATKIAKERAPDLLIDGPMQYDAATTENVAKQKAPDSPVAGQATVLVFPDLNTGNTTYKAVQRSAKVVSIGPMLQGLNKPVNDLSRGALVEDIVYTIALTAIQANQTHT